MQPAKLLHATLASVRVVIQAQAVPCPVQLADASVKRAETPASTTQLLVLLIHFLNDPAGRLGPSWSQESETPCGSPTWLAGAWELLLFSYTY